jgi:hypothetical protein
VILKNNFKNIKKILSQNTTYDSMDLPQINLGGA